MPPNHAKVRTPTQKAGKAFMDELLRLMQDHNISLSHEDDHGQFLLVAGPDKRDLDWVMQADYGSYLPVDEAGGSAL